MQSTTTSSSSATWEQLRQLNLNNWDERVSLHRNAQDSQYAKQIQAVISEPDGHSFNHIEQKTLLPLIQNKNVLHLQCHFGLDTLSLKKCGAKRVIGLDFSPSAVQEARQLSVESKLAGSTSKTDTSDNGGEGTFFVESDVYEAVSAVKGEKFDVVFTSVGAICWLPDIRKWAQVIADCLKPGGAFYFRDGHPILNSLEAIQEKSPSDLSEDSKDGNDGKDQTKANHEASSSSSSFSSPSPALAMKYPYFELDLDHATHWHDTDTYATAEQLSLENKHTVEWNHSASEIIMALIQAGLRIDLVQDHKCLDWKHFDFMVQETPEDFEYGMWRLPKSHRNLAPLMLSIVATKPV